VVLVTPASPVETTTVVPAAVACSSAALMTSRLALSSGKRFAPNDSLRTFTWSTLTS
jgi:hypothetical protein